MYVNMLLIFCVYKLFIVPIYSYVPAQAFGLNTPDQAAFLGAGEEGESGEIVQGMYCSAYLFD